MISYSIRSEQVCEIPVIGRLVPGVDVKITDYQVELFEKVLGYKLGAANLPTWCTLTVHLTNTSEKE